MSGRLVSAFLAHTAAAAVVVVCCMLLLPARTSARCTATAAAFLASSSSSSLALPHFRHAHDQHRRRFLSTSTPMQAVADLRKEYSSSGLEEDEVPSEPLTLFRRWLDEAVAAQVIEPNAMCLSTVSLDGKPSGRYVLLKGLDERGFVWYTNYQSRKGQELAAAAFHADGADAPAAGPPACLTFWWGDLERSVRIEGTVERVAEVESKAYFESRPRGSRIGAWASKQSRPIASRTALEAQYEDVCAQFGGEKEEGNEEKAKPVPKPEHWGGFRLVPERVEFWKGRQSRLHDRLAYALQQQEKAGGKKWGLERLQP